jgi:anthranilate synthase component 1
LQPLRPDFVAFSRLAGDFSRVPVVATLIADELTPVSAFARIAADAERAFLFESVVGGEQVARYSFLGANPAQTVQAFGRSVRVRDHLTGEILESDESDPLRVVAEHLRRRKVAPLDGLPRFLGGAVGYAGYDVVRYYENLPNAPADDRGLPDLVFDIYETLIIFDHAFKRLHVVAHADVTGAASPEALRTAYQSAASQIETIVARLALPKSLRALRLPPTIPPRSDFRSSFTRERFEQAVAGCLEYIRAGDIFQVVLSQRLELETKADAFELYRASRVINPSPFMFYVRSPEATLVGASPEILCRVEDGEVTNRPLAGTRKRGADAAEDERLKAELLADPKERAEHIMLVDLGRNDLGRVCDRGSVQVRELMAVEHYSHVMHLSSTVTGRLRADLTAFDALRATLPVGTVSGAPKVRAMQIIDEFEPTRRGPYAGAVGYFDFNGNMDTCIALRTLVVVERPGRPRRVYAQVGAGIVADSDPQREYEETINKARGMLTAITLAEQGGL